MARSRLKNRARKRDSPNFHHETHGDIFWHLIAASFQPITGVMKLDEASTIRLALLSTAPANRWIALSSDETRIVATGETFQEVAEAAERSGEFDPLIIHVPSDWTPRVL